MIDLTKISERELQAFRDPVARMVYRKWIREGRVQLVPEENRCKTL